MVEGDYKKLEQYVAERLNQGATPEAIKRELVMRGINPAAVDYVFKRVETNNRIQGKDFMQYGKILGIALIVILAGFGIYYFYTSSAERETVISKPKLFATSFESTPSESTIINATSVSSYSHKEYNNVPDGWVVRFNSSGIFKWDDNVANTGLKSIRMNKPGNIVVEHTTNLVGADRNLTLIAWVKSNDLDKGFAFIEIGYGDDDNSVVLKRSKKIIGSNNWDNVKVPFNVPAEVDSIYIKLKLLNKNEHLELYEKLPTLNGTVETNEKLPRNAVWFDDVKLA